MASPTKGMWTKPPEGDSLEQILKYAVTVDAYKFAEEVLHTNCGDLANSRLDIFRETGKWEGTFEELRCCLFFEQRRLHHTGGWLEGKYLAEIKALFWALVYNWYRETEPTR